MEAPKLAGYTRDGRSYELTAAAAAQDLKRPHFIELKDIRAKVELQDGALINVTADAGVYDNKSEIVTLDRNVLVTASSGTRYASLRLAWIYAKDTFCRNGRSRCCCRMVASTPTNLK